MKTFFIYFFIFLILIPISLPIGEINGKPIDLIYSDILIIFGLLHFFIHIIFRKSVTHQQKKTLVISVLVTFFFLALTSLHIIFRDGDFLWLISTIKFIKIFLIVFFSFFFFEYSKISPTELIHISAKIAALIVVILFFSEVINSANFPKPRWGGYFFNIDVYGFPNSPAVYYVFLFALILSGLTNKNCHSLTKAYYTSALILISLIIIFTVSRTAVATLLFFSITYFFTYSSKKIKIYISLSIMLIFIYVYINWGSISNTLEFLVYKIDKTISGNDAISGRDIIWAHTLELIAEKPLFGYGFESYVLYSLGHGTPHQQYLEVIYKSGVIGIFIYMYFFYRLYFIIKIISNFSKSYQLRKHAKIILLVFISLLFSNFAQPTFSYSVAGNAVVFYITLLSFYSLENNIK